MTPERRPDTFITAAYPLFIVFGTNEEPHRVRGEAERVIAWEWYEAGVLRPITVPSGFSWDTENLFVYGYGETRDEARAACEEACRRLNGG